MGPSASRLFILDCEDMESLPRTANACPNIQSCTIIGDISLGYIRALFVVPKPELKKLVRFVGEANVFQVLAEEVSTLEDFVYSGSLPDIPLFLNLWLTIKV